MNVLEAHKRIAVETLLASGLAQREIARRTGINRRTIRALAAKCSGVATGFGESAPLWPPALPGEDGAAAVQTAPPRPPAFVNGAASACEPHRAFITGQAKLGRNAISIYQDLVELHGFVHAYNSVKRFVRGLKVRDPERFDVLEYAPGEEAQVDFGQGALTLLPNGKYKRPWLFVMTLKYSGKSFRRVLWKADQQAWARMHEEAFRAFGGSSLYVVLDNLKQGVIRPDLYEPQLNAVYAAMLSHYRVVADVCRIRDPNRKGTVESAIQHTQSTALKGRRFDSIQAQNTWLDHWEERWAAPRIHGRKKRQVLEMYREEKPYLRPLPIEAFQYFREGLRTVDDAGTVQVDGCHYAALPARLYSQVRVHIYAREIQILGDDGQVLRRHAKSMRKGAYVLGPEDRLFNPSRETARLLGQVAKIGPHSERLGQALFDTLGRPGQKALMGLANLARTFQGADIEAVAQQALDTGNLSYQALKRALEHRSAAAAAPPDLIQTAPEIRAIDDYQLFFNTHTHR